MKSCVRDVMTTRVVAVGTTTSFKEMIFGRDLVEAIRHIDGVIAVRDQLSYAGAPR